ncbi:hypothetical protein EG347_21350 [Chryseobacterium sp. G0186]|uniref:hypothetical protein n=1 Tax=Chryseobacterium sp. G0186 TaxID=2487064 RepID=UPI000F513AE5|nr:hypothetical protein [Chryseobacterium sp. G0186]AZA79849.1 hypothetical protein EG347_21350 [Chryseobacterium sp. G0186]
MKKEKSFKNLEAKGLGNFTKTFGKNVFGGQGAPTRSIKEIIIKAPHLSDDEAPIDQTNDGPY